jgi:hypothetical protein
MISLIQRMIYGPKVTFVPDIPVMRDCTHCKKCVTHHMANRLATHLIEDHKLEDNQAYETVNWVFSRLSDHLKNKNHERKL